MISLRRANEMDLDAVLPLVQAYRVFYKQQPQSEREREFIQTYLRNNASAIYIASADGTPAGFMQLFKTFSTVHLAPVWILEDLFVDPRHRKSGIASQLLERALQHARQEGASSMFLETAFDNTIAQSVYERAGWTREGHFYKYNAPLS